MTLFVISCILLIAAIVVFILVLALPPVKDTNPPNNPVFPPLLKDPAGFQQSFIQTPNGGFVLDPDNPEDGTKPFVIMVTKDGPIKNAILFSNLTPAGQPALATEVTNTSRGFTFGVKKKMDVVALQVVDQLFVTTENDESRPVAIFNVDTGSIVVQNSVNKSTDSLIQGFRTHALLPTEQATLFPGTKYACVAIVNEDDLYSSSQFVASPPKDVMIGSTEEETKAGYGWTGFVTSDFVALPTNFTSAVLPIVYASFQVQEKKVPFTRTFEVDNLFARFPPEYIYNLNVIVNDAFSVTVTDGLCNSVYNDINLVLPTSSTVVPGIGVLTADTWFAVYVAARDDALNGNDASVFVSSNINELPNIDTARMRRVGWVLTKPDSLNLYRLIQSGDGVRRRTFYQEPVVVSIKSLVDTQSTTLLLTQVPPTSTEVVLQLEVTFEGPILPSTLELEVNTQRITLQGEQLYQIRNVTVPLTTITIPFQLTVTAFMPGFVGSGNFQFNALQFTDDV